MMAIGERAALFLGPLMISVAVCFDLMTAGLLRAEAEAPSACEHFVRREGDRLLAGDQEFRFITLNVPNLHRIEDHFTFEQRSVWRWPDEFEITDALESVRQMGGRAVRIQAFSVQHGDSEEADHVHVRGPGEFHEDAFRTLDKVLQIANQKGVRLIIPFVDQDGPFVDQDGPGGSGAEYAAFRRQPAEHFWTDRQIISDFKDTIRFVLERTNTYTGVRYRDDKAILGWETGNALDAPPAWTHEIAAYLKSLDPNHLVIAGNADHGERTPLLDDPGVDVLATHHSGLDDPNLVEEVRAAIAAARGEKPCIVAGLRVMDLPTLEAVLEAVIGEGADGVLVSSLRFHRRDGGFYWHSEPTGQKELKAYHWPGFASGEAYSEREVIDQIRRKAAEIRGTDAPPLPIPGPPHLLPITSPGQIRWRGSTGATSYEVHRSGLADGPWELVGQEISDAAVPYRPLFSDNRTELAKDYFYHIVAKNERGASPPSNVVGPVTVAFFEMVDEFEDRLLVRQQEGPVEWIHHTARRAQEDFHRLRMSPGGSITYQVGEPIRHVTLFALRDGERPENLDFTISSEGTTFTPLELKREAFPAPDGEPAYFQRLRYEGAIASPKIHFLRITLPARTSEPGSSSGVDFLDLSRLEIRFGKQP